MKNPAYNYTATPPPPSGSPRHRHDVITMKYRPCTHPAVPLLIILTILAALPCLDINAQSDTYKRSLVSSTIVFDTDMAFRSGYQGDHGHIGSIAVSEGGDQWSKLSSGAMCYYDNDPSHSGKWGAIYNGYAVNDSRNICPAGWHVPSREEYEELFKYLGGKDKAPVRLKTPGNKMDGTGLWRGFNFGSSNNSGFTVIPAGGRSINGGFSQMHSNAFFWGQRRAHFSLSSRHEEIMIGGANPEHGFSGRCMKDK